MRSIEDLLRAIVREEIARAQNGGKEVYSTTSEALYPPGARSRRQARERIRRAGGRQVGRGKAAYWEIDAATYVAASSVAAASAKPAAVPIPASAPPSAMRSDAEVMAMARAETPTRATRRAS
ncbi:MAG: hypothetical protein KIS87_15225 [Phycisphaeraceae bacterium]|nr:hypothetical protein [Phycisphaeraceae bacterium]